MTVFDAQPDFIDRDPRKHDTTRRIENQFQDTRFKAWAPPEMLEGTTVLDLGCCVAAAGGYMLAHGATRYVGVELSETLSTIARENLTKYHPNADWEIVVMTAEEYLATTKETFDVVLAGGVVHGATDAVLFIAGMAHVADNVVIESIHPPMPFLPYLINKLHPHVTTAQEKYELSEIMRYIEYGFPIIGYNDNGKMMLDDTTSSVTNILRSAPSIQMLKLLMNRLGFAENMRPYETLKKELPAEFGFGRRFAISFHRVGPPVPMSFADLYDSNDKQTASWDDLKKEMI